MSKPRQPESPGKDFPVSRPTGPLPTFPKIVIPEPEPQHDKYPIRDAGIAHPTVRRHIDDL